MMAHKQDPAIPALLLSAPLVLGLVCTESTLPCMSYKPCFDAATRHAFAHAAANLQQLVQQRFDM